MTVKLDVAPRTEKVKTVRAEGKVPGVVYGPKQEPVSISVDAFTLERLVREAGESTIITLEGLAQPVEVLIHGVEFDAKRSAVAHVDFYAIERGKELTTNVALEFIGEAPVVKTGATPNKILHEVEVTCRPSDLPSEIVVDLSVLADEEAVIYVKDLVVPAGVKIENDAEEIVVTVSVARTEEVDETAEVDMGAIEVETKGKEEVA